MQSMLYGLGSGGRVFTFWAGMRGRPAAAFSSFLRYSAKRSRRPLIKSCGPVCGMPFTVFDTSTTVSPFSTPSLKSSKYKSFISSPSVWRSFGRQRDERSGLNSRMKFHSGMSPTLVTAWVIGSRRVTPVAGSCRPPLPATHFAEAELDLAHRNDRALCASGRARLSARRVVAAHAHVVVVEHRRRMQWVGPQERRDQRYRGRGS